MVMSLAIERALVQLPTSKSVSRGYLEFEQVQMVIAQAEGHAWLPTPVALTAYMGLVRVSDARRRTVSDPACAFGQERIAIYGVATNWATILLGTTLAEPLENTLLPCVRP